MLLSLVRAPLGYGKSTLLAQYAASLESPWAWYRLDSGDNQPLALLLHLHHALGLPESSTVNIDELWAAIIGHLEGLQSRFTLILDDLHLLRSAPACRYLEELLHHAPDNLHLLAACEGEPALPLSHLRRDQRLQTVDVLELALGSEEILELGQVRGQLLDSDLAYVLRSGSEGWISGILFALGLRAEQDYPDTSRRQALRLLAQQTFEHVASYFREEALRPLSAPLLHFLERVAVVRAFDADLAACLSGTDNASLLIRQLQNRDLFIQQRSGERLVYRLHPLLRRTLYQSLCQRDPERVNQLHRQSADWLMERHYYTEAIYQLGRARDFNRLLAAIERHSFDLLREGEVNAIVDFLADLPGEDAADHFTLAVTEASTVMVTNDLPRASACLRYLDRLVRRREIPTRRPERVHQTLGFLRSRLATLGGNFSHGLALVERALRQYPQASAATAVLHFNRASCLFALGRLHHARADATRALAELEALGFVGYTNMLQLLLGQIELALGLIDAAEERFLALGQPRSTGAPRNFYDLFQHLGQGQVLLLRNRPAQAAHCFSLAEAVALNFPHCAGLPWVLHQQACRHAAQGELGAARTRWDEARRLARQFKLFALYRQIGAWRARLAVRESDSDYILAWLEEWHWCRRHYGAELQPEEWLAYAWVQRHLGQQAAAEQIALSLHELAQAEDHHQLQLDLYLLDAALRQDKGDRAAALASLEQALQLAAQDGYGQLLQFEGGELGELFRLLITPQARRQYGLDQPLPPRERLAVVLQGLSSNVPRDIQRQLEPLTPREQDVLRRMARGQGNQQIADSLYISLSTVKTHINNLFRKLDASDRDAALQAARALNLLD
ncbi:HTH-type transcriptional regulator MalT [compost metagenome]